MVELNQMLVDKLKEMMAGGEAVELTVELAEEFYETGVLCSEAFASLGPWHEAVVLEIWQGKAIIVPAGKAVVFRTLLKENV